jgi:hypothetical protein
VVEAEPTRGATGDLRFGRKGASRHPVERGNASCIPASAVPASLWGAGAGSSGQRRRSRAHRIVATIAPLTLLRGSIPWRRARRQAVSMKKPSWGWVLRAGGIALCASTLPRLVFGNAAPSQVELARSVASTVVSGVAIESFHTGSERFDGEWVFGTFLMSTLGLGQVVLAHPEQRAALLPAMERSVRELVSDQANAFGTEAWGNRGFATLASAEGEGHGYLGYANLALSMLRLVEPSNSHAALSDELTDAMARRLAAAPHALFETYPGEAYAPDMAMVAGSIALHDCAVGRPERAFMPGWRAAFSRYIDPKSGLLYQAADARTGRPLDSPRGSGTAISAYALSFADARLSRRLHEGLRRQAVSVLGFGMMREYPAGHTGLGDIDSGPVLFGVGVSASGFSLAAARLHGDRELFSSLYRTVDLFGVPLHDTGQWHFMSGGPLGNAIMLAMTSASYDWSKYCRKAAL